MINEVTLGKKKILDL